MRREFCIACLLIFLVFFSFVHVLSAANIPGITEEDKRKAKEDFLNLPEAKEPPLPEEYQSHKILLKLVEGRDPAEVLLRAGLNTVSIEEISCSLPNIDTEKSDGLKPQSNDKGHNDSWYWYTGDKPQEIYTQGKDKRTIVEYEVVLTDNFYAADAIDKLRDIPEVLYVMPAS